MAYPSRAEPVSVARQSLLRRGLLLEALTVGWNVTEGIIAVAAGVAAGSVALISFGIDSFIETTSAIVVGWRLRLELRQLNTRRRGGGEPPASSGHLHCRRRWPAAIRVRLRG